MDHRWKLEPLRRIGALHGHREVRLPDERGGWHPLPADVRRLVRTAGSALAATSLVLAFAAGAQAPVYGAGDARMNGALPWIFALFAAAAILGIFLFVLWLVRGPSSRPPGAPPPGHAP
ncbi:MAG: hypothetical protein QM767_23370 [Anaeromyxobacter sp.]